ncbi:MAG: ATP-binding protein [Actinomycetota bacterium]
MNKFDFDNPFRPGAGHRPPHLAGRKPEMQEFQRLLTQETVLENMILTGLRGVGKTVLLDALKPQAIKERWLWIGTDLSESSSVSEETMAIRLMTDLSVVTSSLVVERSKELIGFTGGTRHEHTLNFNTLTTIFNATPGLIADKLKNVLEIVWRALDAHGARGLIFAYDEAQNLADQAQKEQYPLSMMLDVFQSLQRKDMRFMLVLTGLPTLFPKLVEARTYAERMFHLVFLDRLGEDACRDAILKPIEAADCPLKLRKKMVQTIIDLSGGYPYFIQFVCKEVYDAFIQQLDSGKEVFIPIDEIVHKLDNDFFAGRWNRATDRQRELLSLIARLPNCDTEFSVLEITGMSREGAKPFSPSQVSQMLASLGNSGLVYKNRHGRYSFAVPLLGQFIARQPEPLA